MAKKTFPIYPADNTTPDDPANVEIRSTEQVANHFDNSAASLPGPKRSDKDRARDAFGYAIKMAKKGKYRPANSIWYSPRVRNAYLWPWLIAGLEPTERSDPGVDHHEPVYELWQCLKKYFRKKGRLVQASHPLSYVEVWEFCEYAGLNSRINSPVEVTDTHQTLAPDRSMKQSRSPRHEHLYVRWVERCEGRKIIPTRGREEQSLGRWFNVNRDTIRDLRREYAPDHWKADGPKIKGYRSFGPK